MKASTGNTMGVHMSKIDMLFTKGKIGRYEVEHRLVMSPMTRGRAGKSGIPTESMATYYRQRASAALIISEATHISPQAYGWLNAPGIFNEAQIQGWKKVTAAVHEKGGRLFSQLWHVGNVSHRSLLPDGQLPVGPSAVKPTGQIHVENGKIPYETSRALELSEIPQVIEQYRTAAKNALSAGFDGVELHAGGYLPQQFLDGSTNLRTDEYGGSIENRSRFVLEVLAALTDVWGGDRVGIKIAPGIAFAGTTDSNPNQLYQHLVSQFHSLDLAYMHVMERAVMPEMGVELRPEVDHAKLRSIFNGSYIANGNYTRERAENSLVNGSADFIAMARAFLANPDLVERFRTRASLTAADMATFYSEGDKGYIDYPTLTEGNKQESKQHE